MSIIDFTTHTGHDFEAFVGPDGKPRLLARTIPPPGQKKFARAWGDVNSANTIPRSEWSGLAFYNPHPNVPILDQGQVGSCNPHAWASALMQSRDQAGQSFELLSASMLYAQINGGQDQGSDLAQGADAVTKTGICLATQMPEGFFGPHSISQAMIDTAKRFRADPDDVYSLANWDEIVSASILRYKVILSVYVAGNWGQLDANGCPPFHRGSGNHAVNFGEGVRVTKSGLALCDGRNSWSDKWGNAGRFSIYEDFYADQNYAEAYAIRWPSQDPLDPNIGPVAN